jgi:hypothetical protein
MSYAMLPSTALVSLIIFVLGYRYLTSTTQRIHFGVWLLGFWFYSCAGAGYDTVGNLYRIGCVIFPFVFALSFLLTLNLTAGWAASARRVLSSEITATVDSVAWKAAVIVVYIGSLLVFLVYPDVVLYRLIDPPSPDLRQVVAERFSDPVSNPIIRSITYINLLVYPFFLVVLSRSIRRPIVFAGLILMVAYIAYCRDGYLARGGIVMAIFLLGGGVYMRVPRLRRRVVICVAVLCPFMAAGFVKYGHTRLGADAPVIGPVAAIGEIYAAETQYPVLSDMVIRAKERADLREYCKWMATLPVPKMLTGKLSDIAINYEMSELLLGRPRGSPGWFVCLAGLMTESFYIYGPEWFWLHAAFLGVVTALLCRVVECHADFTVLGLYTAYLFGYGLQRGGIAAVLPQITNQFLLLYAWLLLVFYVYRRGSGHRVRFRGFKHAIRRRSPGTIEGM